MPIHDHHMPDGYNCSHKAPDATFQTIFKDAQEAYKALPWWKRLFKFDIAEFEEVDGRYVTYWNNGRG